MSSWRNWICDKSRLHETSTEKAHFWNSEASCLSHCCSLLGPPQIEVWATGEDRVSSDPCVLASDALHQMFNCNIQTLVLTIQVPFDIKDNRKCMFLAKENLHEGQELWTVSFRRRITPGAPQLIAKTPRLFWRSSLELWDGTSQMVLLFLSFWGALASCLLKKFTHGDVVYPKYKQGRIEIAGTFTAL